MLAISYLTESTRLLDIGMGTSIIHSPKPWARSTSAEVEESYIYNKV